MPYSSDSGGKTTPGQGNEPNQFAQVGMGGSQGGGQFEQGDGQSGSLQDQQGGTTTTESVPIEHDHEHGHEGVAGAHGDFAGQESGGQQQQQQEQQHRQGSQQERAPGSGDAEGESLGTGRDGGMGNSGS
jgi:hypothetical protein